MADTFVSKIHQENLEHCFINSAFLSELWAAKDIKAKIDMGLISSDQAQAQLDDEYRHAEVLFKMMKKLDFAPCEDIQFAMQNVLYKRIMNVDLASVHGDQKYFWGIHEITEKRALFNYKKLFIRWNK